jgi:hypothetical protein
MKLRFFSALFLTLTILILFQYCSINRKVASSNIPEIFSPIEYDKFESKATIALISSPISLKIDTTYKNTIIAYELYKGAMHVKWFFGETQWVEKTLYTITYQREIDGVSFKLKVNSFEAPNERFIKWRPVHPTKKTKESLIISKLN